LHHNNGPHYTDTGFKFWHKLLNKAFKLRLSFLNCKMGILFLGYIRIKENVLKVLGTYQGISE
jgi:hypothetical protein